MSAGSDRMPELPITMGERLRERKAISEFLQPALVIQSLGLSGFHVEPKHAMTGIVFTQSSDNE